MRWSSKVIFQDSLPKIHKSKSKWHFLNIFIEPKDFCALSNKQMTSPQTLKNAMFDGIDNLYIEIEVVQFDVVGSVVIAKIKIIGIEAATSIAYYI